MESIKLKSTCKIELKLKDGTFLTGEFEGVKTIKAITAEIKNKYGSEIKRIRFIY